MHCPSCGTEQVEGSSFCHHCGAPAAPTDRDTDTAAPLPEIPVSAPTSFDSEQSPKMPPSSPDAGSSPEAAPTPEMASAPLPYPAPDAEASAAERTLWMGRPAAAHMLGVYVRAVLGFIAVVAIALGMYSGLHWEQVAFWFVAMAMVFIVFWAIWRYVFDCRAVHYRLTTQRLTVSTGLIVRAHNELELYRVDDVSLKQSLWERVVGLGTICLITSDPSDPELAIHGVYESNEIKEMIRKHSHEARRARGTLQVQSI